MPLGRAISVEGLRQLHASESEKERFVTFYFNGQQELPFPGEDRLIVPSPKVPTYDLKPEMSARELTAAVIDKLSHQNDYSFVVINFANADMVGHTGNLAAAIKAVETLDECMGKLSSFVLARGGLMIITADHGNAEEMINTKTGAVSTEHSSNPVPFIAISEAFRQHAEVLTSGILADVAPTILSYMGIEIPGSMMGRNLLADITHSTIPQ
jgi:2,3-bisphosphoglycerate-independent phosphoglycerate mutase